MNSTELKELKKKLETDIKVLTENFINNTGFQVNEIEIDISNSFILTDDGKKCCNVNVKCEVNLDI